MDFTVFLDRVWAWRARRTSLAVGEPAYSSRAGCVLGGVFSTLFLTISISSSLADLAMRRVLARGREDVILLAFCYWFLLFSFSSL